MSEKVVYRTTDQGALDVWEASSRDHDAMTERIKKFLAEISPDHPDRNMLMRGRRFIGIEHRKGWPVPDGWRIGPDGHAVPDRRTRVGKNWDKRLAAVSPMDTRAALSEATGMPSMAIRADHGRFLTPGIEVHGDALYVIWGGELDERERGHINDSIWERVPLSQYYAAVEADSAATS